MGQEDAPSFYNRPFLLQPPFPFTTAFSFYNRLFLLQPPFPFTTAFSFYNRLFLLQPPFPLATALSLRNHPFLVTTLSFLSSRVLDGPGGPPKKMNIRPGRHVRRSVAGGSAVFFRTTRR